MFVPNLPMHQELAVRSRLRMAIGFVPQTQLWELAWLISMGVAAALAATFFDFILRIPGHSILRGVFPMSLGLALVPRRGAGVVMGASGLTSVAALSSAGYGPPGLGATTSLALIGPCLDAILWRAGRGWVVYAGFALAGLVSNITAFFVRGAGRVAGVGTAVSGLARGGGGGGGGGGLGRGLGRGLGTGGGAGGLDPWWSYAPLSYMACGLLAGLFCAAIWFAARPRRTKPGEVDSS